MAVEHAGWSELTELVADHLFGDQNGDVLLPVVDAEVQADELRKDGRAPAPDLDHLVTAGCAHGFRLAQQITVNKWALPNRTCHNACP